MRERKDIPDIYKWDLSSYYKSEEDFNKDLNYIKKNYTKIENFEGKLNNKKDIYKCFVFQTNLSKVFSKLYVYSSLLTKEDGRISENDQRLETIDKLSVEYGALSSFVDVELSDLSDEFLLSLKNDKKFKDYDLIIDDIIKFKKHMLSKKEEKLLSLTSEFAGGFSQVFEKLDNVDIKFDKVVDSKGKTRELNSANYGVYLESQDRNLRKSAMANMNKAYGELNYTIGANYISHIKQDCFYSKIRGFKNSLSASLFSEDIDEVVYNNLVESVNSNLKIMQKYYDIKRKQLDYKTMYIYDTSAPTNSKYNLKLNYEAAFSLVLDACKPLGDDYIENLKKAYNEKWVDVYPNLGKDTGAFSWGCYSCNPVVLLNYEKTTNDIFTLAHELGHAMHTYYSNTNQVYEKAGYEIFVAEVASTVNEMLLVRYKLANSNSDQEKLYYYDYLIKMFKSTLMRQTMFAEFEKFAHQYHENGGALTVEILNNYYYELNKRYFGAKVKLIPEIKYEWSRIPHFYTSYYVYKYATGIICALNISQKLFDGDETARRSYINFLKSGCSKDPVSLLKDAGVDLTKVDTFNESFKIIESFIKEYNALINSTPKDEI